MKTKKIIIMLIIIVCILIFLLLSYLSIKEKKGAKDLSADEFQLFKNNSIMYDNNVTLEELKDEYKIIRFR